MKSCCIFLLFFFGYIYSYGQNVTIIESQSGNPWAYQDTVWLHVANNMGLNAAIAPQSTLSSITNLQSTDVLIVSSATISLPSQSLQTVIDYVSGGGAAYIQAEYVISMQGSMTFDSLMSALGADFQWNSTVSGSLTPMLVLGELSTNPNTVSSLYSFNYGLSGSGTGVEPFLEFNGSFFGFVYEDSTNACGAVITTSDEDWTWQNTSPQLMENILNKLMDNTFTGFNNDAIGNNSDFIVYPNPSGDYFTVLTDQNDAVLQIYTISGELVREITINDNVASVNVENLSSGTYLMVMNGAQSKKVMISK